MPKSAAIDAAITWAGAGGCFFYLWTLYRHGRRGAGAQRFLMWLLASLLLVRGFDWIDAKEGLDRLTFAIAAWLPLGITLFLERVLRRHHPLWVKLFALATSAIYFLASVFTRLPLYRPWLLGFAACLAAVVLINGLLLLGRNRPGLAVGENRLASLLVLLVFITAALVLTDFRTLTGVGSVRLGAIAALLFVYSMLGAALRSAPTVVWLARFLRLLGLAAGLSALIALATSSQSMDDWWTATLTAWPVAYAWMILTGIVVNSRELSAEGDTNDFMRWMTQVPLSSPEAFTAALAGAPDAQTHLYLRHHDLAEYDADILTRFFQSEEVIVSLAKARQLRRAHDDALAEPSEQWIDLLERTQMTHGFLACKRPLAVFLLNLPATTSSTAAEMRLRVMHHISHQLNNTEAL
jgi:hypothetical protein